MMPDKSQGGAVGQIAGSLRLSVPFGPPQSVLYRGYYICRAHGKHVILFHERMGGGFPVYYWRQDGI